MVTGSHIVTKMPLYDVHNTIEPFLDHTETLFFNYRSHGETHRKIIVFVCLVTKRLMKIVQLI